MKFSAVSLVSFLFVAASVSALPQGIPTEEPVPTETTVVVVTPEPTTETTVVVVTPEPTTETTVVVVTPEPTTETIIATVTAEPTPTETIITTITPEPTPTPVEPEPTPEYPFIGDYDPGMFEKTWIIDDTFRIETNF
jgi:hypothetical protein